MIRGAMGAIKRDLESVQSFWYDRQKEGQVTLDLFTIGVQVSHLLPFRTLCDGHFEQALDGLLLVTRKLAAIATE